MTETINQVAKIEPTPELKKELERAGLEVPPGHQVWLMILSMEDAAYVANGIAEYFKWRERKAKKEQEKETDALRYVTLSEEILTMLSKEEESDAMNAVCRAAAGQAFRSGSLVRSFADAMSLWHASFPVPTK